MSNLDMRSTKIISISMPEAQVKAAEQLAKAENRTMSELIREALRSYEKQKRAATTEKYRMRAQERNLTEADVVRIIKEWRKDERGKNKSSRS
jgi:Arc/MetJ-type ribon-helix-helix transcriptional regulator